MAVPLLLATKRGRHLGMTPSLRRASRGTNVGATAATAHFPAHNPHPSHAHVRCYRPDSCQILLAKYSCFDHWAKAWQKTQSCRVVRRCAIGTQTPPRDRQRSANAATMESTRVAPSFNVAPCSSTLLGSSVESTNIVVTSSLWAMRKSGIRSSMGPSAVTKTRQSTRCTERQCARWQAVVQ